MEKILYGAYDLHIHSGPDVVARKCNDFQIAKRSFESGMAGIAIKCHYAETAARASILQKKISNYEYCRWNCH